MFSSSCVNHAITDTAGWFQDGAIGVGIFLLVFWGGSACFSVWRAQRLWKDPDYYQQVVSRGVFRFKEDVSRGLVRGWAPFAAGVVALLPAMLMFVAAGVGQHQEGPSPAVVVAVLLIVVFLVGVVLQLTVAWFNRPRWCVPAYLRQETAAWAQRHPRKAR
ncbi:hypothetical protein FB563_1019 [Streptomyces puniciscabiei]|uniref:Uncharacterized protein n=1 Tax=Streptomyces puniciscabiei TaxID=164348 RepID=A0A542UAH9_9ACTN|nr:hypothetical protein [Streptomyces puniciscabiei]TQK96092.1 hypothetical protein FB563_1019 [Streptomyces puniciscabiei]